jgi:hypothetical protein
MSDIEELVPYSDFASIKHGLEYWKAISQTQIQQNVDAIIEISRGFERSYIQIVY